MNRKHTILIAVLVNASLLVVLFVTALTTQEVSVPVQTLPIVQSSLDSPKLDAAQPIKPLFGDVSDLALREPPASESKPNPAPVQSAPETPALHPLPAKIPEETAPIANTAPASDIKQTSPAAAPTVQESPYLEIVVKKGDSLDKLAKEHHTSVSELIKINRLPSSFLKVGQMLKVPAQRKAPVPSKPAQVAAKEDDAISYYTVKVGDNPWTIAMKHNMKVEELLRLNGLNEEKARKLKPGDRLRTKYTPGR